MRLHPVDLAAQGGQRGVTGPLCRREWLRAAMVASAFALSLPSPLHAPLAAVAADVPTPKELSRLTRGYDRINYLLANWEDITTICNGVMTDEERMQVARTEGGTECNKSPLKVQTWESTEAPRLPQEYIGFSSTLDPLFRADKLLIRATPLVPESKQDAYSNTVDKWIERVTNANTLAYTSSWGEANPNGSKENIEELLKESKREVILTQAVLKEAIDLLGLL